MMSSTWHSSQVSMSNLLTCDMKASVIFKPSAMSIDTNLRSIEFIEALLCVSGSCTCQGTCTPANKFC